MTPIEWAIRPLRKYADFKGRAPRAEYWWYVAAATIVGVLFGILDRFFVHTPADGLGPFSLALTLGLLMPGVAVAVRRLHDVDRTGWWALAKIPSYLFAIVQSAGIDLRAVSAGMSGSGAVLALLVALVFAWLLLGLLMLVFMLGRGSEGGNRFGDDPYGRGNLEEVFA